MAQSNPSPPAAAPLPWARVLFAGAAARLCTACVSLSFHARDDYFHVLAPALRWLQDPSFDWDHSDLPGAGIRSHLLPRLVWLLLRGFIAVGINTPEGQLRGLYIFMGIYSLTLIPAMAIAARRCFADDAVTRLSMWLAALFFPFPYAGTRLLIEAAAMPPLIAGVALAADARPSRQVWGGLLLAAACWWRFQVVSAVAGVAAVLLWDIWRQRRPALALVTVGGGFAAGTAVQGGFDILAGGTFLGPVWQNILVNVHPAAHLSRSTAWGYAAMLLILSLPPLTLWLVAPLGRALRQAPAAAAALIVFVLFHSWVPHKEDRFLLPILPVYTLLLAAACVYRQRGRDPSFWQRTWPTARVFGGIFLGVGLLVAVTSQSQANLRDAMIALRDDPQARAAISLGPELQLYFLGERALPTRHTAQPDEAWLHAALVALAAENTPANRFVMYATDQQVGEVLLRLEGYACGEPRRVDGYWLDRLLQRLNPRRNRRRGAVLVYGCEPPALAQRGQTASGGGNAG